MPTACCRPRRRVGLAQQRSEAQPPHGAALALWLRRQLEAALLRPQADALQRKRGVEEQRDGRDASDVGGVAAREGAHEEVRGEVEEAGGRRRIWRGSGGGGGGEVRVARRGWTSREKNFLGPAHLPGLGPSCPQPDIDHPARWVRFLAPRPWMCG